METENEKKKEMKALIEELRVKVKCMTLERKIGDIQIQSGINHVNVSEHYSG